MTTAALDANYTGTERSWEISSSSPVPDHLFEIRPANLPSEAKPIYDDALGVCVGYSWESVTGVWHIFDVTGQAVGIEEAPLEHPLFDPFDLILLGAAFVKLVRSGFAAARGVLAEQGATALVKRFAQRVLPQLRVRLNGLSAHKLKFTETSARHMANPGRRVPLHILHLAIRFGKRTADPQKVTGVFRYEIPMTRLVKRGTVYVRETKTLEVVVRESDWTILHFMYF